MKRDNFLDQFYTIDPKTGDYIVEIALKDYDDIFNSWDSSLYNIRDLDSSLKSFLVDCSYDIDDNKKIILRFNMQNEKKDLVMEKNIENGIRNYFAYCIYMLKKAYTERKKMALVYIFASLVFTATSVYLKSIVEQGFVLELILLSLTVGGWVFLWEAFSRFFIQSNDVWKRRKQFERLIKAPMIFNYR